MKINLDTPARRQLIAAALDKHAALPSRAMARLLCRQHPEQFLNFQSAYSAVRLRRGAMGKGGSARRGPAHRHRTTPPAIPPLPASKARRWATRILPLGNILVLADLHFPYQDNEALEAALVTGEQAKADTIFLNGDVFDFYSISRFDTDPKDRNLRKELESGAQFFAHLRARFPKAAIWFKQGNHDERWDAFIWRKAPELWDLPQLTLEAITGMEEHGITMLPRRCRVTAHKLDILHGHELDKGFIAPVNPARGAFLRTTECVMVGHYHRTSEHIERSSRGRLVSCFSTGCLAGLWPDYSVANKWNHGFAIVEHATDGFTVHNKRILNGKVL